MKITRKQLRRLINESISGSRYYNVPPRDPTLHLPPEHREKIGQLTGHEDESFQRMGYDLATTLQQDELVFPEDGEPYEEPVYKGDDYLDDLSKHEYARFMRETGGLAQYLTDEDIEMLRKVKGKELGYGLFGHAGFGFQFEINGKYAGMAISPDALIDMATRVAEKKKNITMNDVQEHQGMDSGVEAHHKTATMIMKLSGKTNVSSIMDGGIGEVIEHGERKGEIDFYDPRYEKLYKSGKLIIDY
jgi:hypothetical protein